MERNDVENDMLTLETPITALATVGPAVAGKLKKLGIITVKDLIFYFPFRHEDLSRVTPIRLAAPGLQLTVRGRVEQIENQRSRWRRTLVTEAIVADAAGDKIKVVWFHQPYLPKTLPAGTEVFLSGKVADTKYGLELVAPTYEPVKTVQTHTARIVPVYSTTAGVTSRHIRFLVHRALSSGVTVGDPIPPEVSKPARLMLRSSALRTRHFPQNWEELKLAERRFDFEELFILALRNLTLRAKLKRAAAPVVPFDEQATKQFVSSLPFPLTGAQRRAAWEVIKDLGRPFPANRLINGDVGSGKTMVATIAAVNVARAGFQTALLAPTEILAEQHVETLRRTLKNTNVRVALLTSSQSSPEVRKEITEGRAHIIIGTHALLESKVAFHRLGLAVVDEQHRFGVEQRKGLQQKMGIPPLHLPPASQEGEIKKSFSPLEEGGGGGGFLPHLVSMTATPIPRTLALTLFGDLDLSVIDEMPPGRKKVETIVVGGAGNSPNPSLQEGNRADVEDFIRRELTAGRQAFVVCPTIDPHDRLDIKSVKEEVERLATDVFKDFKVGVLHGRLKAKEKDAVMTSFVSGETQVLVATSVIEVGIDVPNATMMLIENADRFGLAALHQLRGRVGRGGHQSYCFLVPSEEVSEQGRARLAALARSSDGFALAEEDLRLRGPGDIFGVAQSGFEDSILPALRDPLLLAEAQRAAHDIFTRDPTLARWLYVKKAVATAAGAVHLE